ncbi:MAG: toll/interleukin-1 receptor domain-containing protein, partial [Chloroflexota bacterium]|nr:toll/interleukin-1 receptor domain-containing protein [Chloroflexota bacterium]
MSMQPTGSPNVPPNIPPNIPPDGSKLFISYRRADSASVAGRVYDRLAAYFGREAIFKDVDNIPIGANFEQVIASVIAQSAITLVLVGPTWASVTNERGRRLDDPQDVVRLEIEAALGRGMPVIPLLVEGASAPDAATLPVNLRPLFAHGAMQARNDPWFDGDMSQLATTLSQWLPLRSAGAVAPPQPAAGQPAMTTAPEAARRGPRRRWLATTLGLIAIATLIVAVAMLGLAGAGLAGAGPFGALGGQTTPLATAPIPPTPLPTPVEHIVIDSALTKVLPGWESDSTCVFQPDGYHAIGKAGYDTFCLLPGSYTNFHLRAVVHAASGAGHAIYLIYFHYTDVKDYDRLFLSFDIQPGARPPTVGAGVATPTPDYSLQAEWRAESYRSGDSAELGSDLIPVNIYGDGQNTLDVYVHGSVIEWLVNGVQVGVFQDPAG